MIKTKTLLKSLTKQPINGFVSRHVPWGINTRNVVNVGELSNIELIHIVNKIKNRERKFLNKIASRNSSLRSFLKDKDINPNPILIPDRQFKKGEIITFTIECLPIKSENPLKTAGSLPDLAEIGILIHFEELGKVIKRKFKINVFFKLLIETSIYGEMFEINKLKTKKFIKVLNFMSKNIVKNHFVTLIDWQSELVKLNTFENTFEKQKKVILSEFENNNQDILKDLLLIFPTIYMSIKPEGNPKQIFINFRKGGKTVIKHCRKAIQTTLKIMAFNKTRKLLNERQSLFPNDLRGTLTPTRDKWAFFAIGPWNKLYPHHGIGVFDTRNNRIEVIYLDDIKIIKKESARYIMFKSTNIF